MDPFAQAHLSELLAAARLEPPDPSVDPDEQKGRTLMTFNAALAALKGVGAISDEEMAEWLNRMLIVVGEKPLEPLPKGVGRTRIINFGGKRTQRPHRPPDPPPVSRFLGLVPVEVPDRPLEYGGRIQILGVELYSDKVSVNWRLAPLPVPERNLLLSWLNKSPTSRACQMTSRRSFETNLFNDCRCNDVPSPLSTTWERSSDRRAAGQVEEGMRGEGSRTLLQQCRWMRND